MSMEITSNYSNYAANYFDSAKKSDSKSATEVKTSTSTNSKDKVQDYYEKLCKKFPQINFNTKGGVIPSNSSKVTVNLSYDCLKKMADDPKFAKEIEWNLSGEVTANSMVYGWAQRDGVVLGGRTVTYDANGNRQSSCGGMRTANAGNNNTNITQKKYKAEEERWLKARKKREEKEKIAKKQAERGAEKNVAEEARKTYSNTNEYRNYLTEKYDCMKSSGYSVAISSSLLSKALGDKKTSKWLEYNLSLIPKVMDNIKSTVAARGSQIISCNIKIEGYDNITTELVTKAEADPGTEKAREELEEKIKERREEKKAQEEKAAKRREEKKTEEKVAERQAEKKAAEEAGKETGEYTVSVTGMDIKAVTQKVIAAASGTSVPIGASFDIKA